ncbi:MAG: site-specific integrase, partial [candidate division NC10 bacterium]|nr:site-specific integrase [candidate division NC10 bacterium]
GQDAKVAANRELGTLKALINQCKTWGIYASENPVAKVRFFPEPRGKERIVTPDEEATLLAAAKEPLRTVILTGLYAGLRVASEALTLRWADVDLARRVLTVQSAHAKSGKRRTVPINTVLHDALSRLAEGAGPEDFVFRHRNGRRVREMASSFTRLCHRLGIVDVTPHCLRHTFASRLVMAGTDLETVRELGGWANLSMVQRYAHPSPQHKADAVERIGQPGRDIKPTAEKVVPLTALQ